MFFYQIGKMMEVYVDDMLVKITHAQDHCQHLVEMFDILRKHEMKLNPKKYAFGMSSRKFLGYMVNNRGIETKLKNIWAIIEMKANWENCCPQLIRVKIHLLE